MRALSLDPTHFFVTTRVTDAFVIIDHITSFASGRYILVTQMPIALFTYLPNPFFLYQADPSVMLLAYLLYCTVVLVYY